MTHNDKPAIADDRANIERYRYLLDFVRDPETRAVLEKLLKEAQARVLKSKSKKSKNRT